MAFTFRRWLRRVFRPTAPFRRPATIRRAAWRPEVEFLESRLAPAFDLTIGTAATTGVLHDAAGDFTATAHGANVSVADLRTDLLAGKNVTISDGTGGTETGNITWQTGADLDFNGVGLGNLKLTVAVDPSAIAGSVALGAKVFDSNTATPDALMVNVSAIKDLTVTGTVDAGFGSVTLAADTLPNGGGHDGAGTLTLGPGSVVKGGAVTLRGAAYSIDTSANPAAVTATNQAVTLSSGLSSPEDLVFDTAGNLYVSNQAANSITKITPAGQASNFISFSANIGPNALAYNPVSGNLYVADINAGTVLSITPQGLPNVVASGFNAPTGLAFDAAGNLYVANFGSGVIDKVAGGQTTVFASGFNLPAGIAFDAAGNLYVNNSGDGVISKVSPDGQTVAMFASGLGAPSRLVFDAQGNLFVTDATRGTIDKVTPQGLASTVVTGLNNPHGLRFDAAGDLYVVSFSGNTVSRIEPGTLTLRTSLPGSPIDLGGATPTTTAAAGVSLTADELARFTAADTIIGDPTQTGAITFVTDTFPGSVEVRQSPTGGGKVELDDGNGTAPALAAGGQGYVLLTTGTGGLLAVNGANAVAEIVGGRAQVIAAGPVGAAGNPVQVAAPLVNLTDTAAGAGVFLDGLGGLTLQAKITTGNQAAVDVKAQSFLTINAGSTISAGSVALAADTLVNGNGNTGVGTLTLAAGTTVTGTNVTLRGAAVSIDTSIQPATVTTTRQVSTFFSGLNAPAGAVFDAAGNLYVANDVDNTVSKITPQGQLSVFASGFGNPQGLAFDAAGNLYVANFDNNTVSKVTPQGQVSTFAAGLNGPTGLTFDAAGNLYVSNQNNNAVSKVTPQGVVSVFASGFDEPEGLAFDATGNLYVANFKNSTVSKVTPDGKTITTFASGFDGPYLIAFDTQGNLFVANMEGNTVSKVTPAGVDSTAASGFNQTAGVALDAQNNLFVTDMGASTVTRVALGGQATAFLAGLANPAALAFDGAGNLYVANQNGNTVSRITPDGQTIATFASGFSSPDGLAFFQGKLYVANANSNTVSRVTPQGQVTTFATGLNGPAALAFDAQGNLYVANGGDNTISKVTPQGQVSTFASGFAGPFALAFDARGNLYVANDGNGTVSKVTPQGQVTTFATGLSGPAGLAFDAQGNLFVAGFNNNTVSKVTPAGQVSTYAAGLNGPFGLAFDAAGNLYVANFNLDTVSRVTPGSLTLRTSVPTLPISLGGAGIAATGVSLSAAALARLNAADVFTVGDAAQAGDITLFSVTSTTGLVQILQNPAGPGTIRLDETTGTALAATNGNARLMSGTGGIQEVNFAFKTGGVNVGTGTLYLGGGGNVGTLARPLVTQADFLGAGTVNGLLFLQANNPLTTVGSVGAAGIFLTLEQDFTTHAGDLQAASVDLFFTNGNGTTTHFDSGGQAVSGLTNFVPLQLVNDPLTVNGNFFADGDFDPNGQAVTVFGQTTVGENFGPDAAAESFLGGLVVNSNFQGGSGPVSAGGVTIGLGEILAAGAGTLTDTGDWTNNGGTFIGGAGTVVLAGTNQHVTGSTVFHNLTKVATTADTLTLQAHTTQTVTGTLTLEGANGQPLQLVSTIPGQPWAFAPQGGLNLNNLNVQDGGDPFNVPGGVLDSFVTGPAPANVSIQANVAVATTGFSYAGLVARYSGPGDTNLYWGAILGTNGKFVADIFRNVNGGWALLASAPVSTGTGALRFDAVGTSLKLYFNGTLVAFASDGMLTTGRAGTRSAPNVSVLNFTAAAVNLPEATLPFSDAFATAANGNQLDTYWSDQLGDTIVANGQAVTAVDNAASADPYQSLTLSTLNGVAEANVVVQADISLANTGIVYSGLVARYSGPGDQNMYWGGLVGVNGAFQAVIYRNVNGTWTQLNAATPVTLTGPTNTLRFEVIGTSLKLFVNGTLAAFADDTVLTTPGTVGLRSGNGVTLANFTADVLTRDTVALPFSDNFNRADGELGNNWVDQLGETQVKGNQAVSHVIDPNSADPNQVLALATLAGLNAADVTVQADVTLKTTGISYAGLVARYSGVGDQNMYWGGVVGVNGSYTAVIYVNVNGTWSPLASATAGSNASTLQFKVQGSSLMLTYGTTTLTATDGQLTSGTAGVRGGDGVSYDNFSVTSP